MSKTSRETPLEVPPPPPPEVPAIAPVTKATGAGAAAAVGGGVILTAVAALAASKWGIPIELAAAIVSPPFAFFAGWMMRWAAKMDPHKAERKWIK